MHLCGPLHRRQTETDTEGRREGGREGERREAETPVVPEKPSVFPSPLSPRQCCSLFSAFEQSQRTGRETQAQGERAGERESLSGGAIRLESSG